MYGQLEPNTKNHKNYITPSCSLLYINDRSLHNYRLKEGLTMAGGL